MKHFLIFCSFRQLAILSWANSLTCWLQNVNWKILTWSAIQKLWSSRHPIIHFTYQFNWAWFWLAYKTLNYTERQEQINFMTGTDHKNSYWLSKKTYSRNFQQVFVPKINRICNQIWEQALSLRRKDLSFWINK